MCRISIIVPIYNAEKWLDKCIESITKQSIDDIEIILVDDGSTDSSLMICKQYQQKDNRIIVLHQDNSGAQKARWNALAIAKGEWVSFVDSDDWIDLSMFEEMLHTADKKTDIVWCGTMMEMPSGTKQVNYVRFKPDSNYLLKELLKGNIPGWSWGKLYRRSLLQDSRIDLNDADMMMEDVLLSVQIFSLGPTIKYIQKPLYHYNLTNENAATSANATIIYHKAYKNIKLIQDYLHKTELFDIYKSDFAMLAMRCKIAISKDTPLREVKRIFPFTHKRVEYMPLQKSYMKYLYWIYFNTGIIGESLYTLLRYH